MNWIECVSAEVFHKIICVWIHNQLCDRVWQVINQHKVQCQQTLHMTAWTADVINRLSLNLWFYFEHSSVRLHWSHAESSVLWTGESKMHRRGERGKCVSHYIVTLWQQTFDLMSTVLLIKVPFDHRCECSWSMCSRHFRKSRPIIFSKRKCWTFYLSLL